MPPSLLWTLQPGSPASALPSGESPIPDQPTLGRRSPTRSGPLDYLLNPRATLTNSPDPDPLARALWPSAQPWRHTKDGVNTFCIFVLQGTKFFF